MASNSTILFPPSGRHLPLLPPPPDPVLTKLPPLFSHPLLADYILTIVGPILAYWLLSLWFELCEYMCWFEKYRIHTPEEVSRRNRVSKSMVAKWVIYQHLLQMGSAFLLSYLDGEDMTGMEAMEQYTWYLRVVSLEKWVVRGMAALGLDGWGIQEKVIGAVMSAGTSLAQWGVTGLGSYVAIDGDWRMKAAELVYWYISPAVRFWAALFILDTWQYFMHRLMHVVPSLYRMIHSHHHRLYCPYAFGALYNHPIEGFLMDTIGAGLAFKISQMNQQGAFIFFTFSTLKTVDDHCGYKLPWDPLQWVFWNNAEYHDVHHQGWGIKTNFSQPFFICWDRWLNTQWTGSPKSTAERYRRAKESIESQASADASSALAQSSSTAANPVPVPTETIPPLDNAISCTATIAHNSSIPILTPDEPRSAAAVDAAELQLVSGAGTLALEQQMAQMQEKMLLPEMRQMGGLGEGDDSGWDDNSSDGSGVGGGESRGKSDEGRELRRRRAAAAR